MLVGGGGGSGGGIQAVGTLRLRAWCVLGREGWRVEGGYIKA